MMDLENYTTFGGSATMKALLKDKCNWDGQSPRALVSHRLGQDPIIESSNWMLVGSIKPISCPASHIWKDAHRDLRVTIDIKDFTVFDFPPVANVSRWLDSGSFPIVFSKKVGREKVRLSLQEAKDGGVGNLCIRAIVIPCSTKEAHIWVGASPFTSSELKDKLSPVTYETGRAPTISLPISQLSDSTSPLKATAVPLGLPDLGAGQSDMEAWSHIDATAAGNAPLAVDMDEYKEATYSIYRKVTNFRMATAGSYLTKLDNLAAGTAAELQSPTLFFPDHRATSDQGQSHISHDHLAVV